MRASAETTTTTLFRMMLGGALPFITIAVGIWFTPTVYTEFLSLLFLGYSATIFTFMTGTLWGAALTSPNYAATNKTLLSAIVLFLAALLGFILGCLLHILLGLIVLTGCYLLLPLAERFAALPFPTAYKKLRSQINFTVLAGHLAMLGYFLLTG
jgi:hypothetical protein